MTNNYLILLKYKFIIKESSCHFFLTMRIFFLMFFFLIRLSFQENLFPSTEQSILLSLKQHWSDPEIFQSWDLKYSPCSWSGVSCMNGFGRVTQLILGGNNITGTIPSTICQLKNLTLIDLSNNNISGTIPASLKDCSKLQHLDLSNNYLRGQIPGRISAEFVKLTYEDNCFDESNLCSTSKNSFPDIPSCSSGDKVRKFLREKHLIILIPAVVVGIAIQSVWIFYMVRKHWWKKDCISMQLVWIFSLIRKPWWKKKQNIEEDLKLISFHKLRVTTEDIMSGLKDENVIGHGGSGKVYRVVIDQIGDTYAVKSIWHDKSSGGKLPKDFLAEVRILGSIRHKNIVKLFCCIFSTDKNLLVYEYFEKQSLDKWLHRKRRAASPGQSSIPALDWRKRLKIAIGVAQGLCYMHHDCTRPIIHRDIKSSNILLDSEFSAKIADFGLAKMLNKRDDDPETASAIAGTFGYIAPEYASTFKVNVKTDIYSFGVVLLELTTGREPIIQDEQMNLAQWAQKHYREGNCIVEALDGEIMEATNLEQMTSVFKLGLMCTGALPSGRPSMKEVCYILQSCRDPKL
ncbi:PREDICTED: receptor-like protein kinase HSL1 isoform X2 [Nicotiana attenuata]|uniref:receptor-like protein kinase HSL1 isoform X2 n=1 Tax=Nicotiana attenuata TaxID=49451 RepID=UPI00090461BC|nr:PREDICTED: receptor-like protein kinase HSL1 isoform X2 [Nicotiana attenuata]